MSVGLATAAAFGLSMTVVFFLGMDVLAYYEDGDSVVAHIVAEQAQNVRNDSSE